MEQEVAIYKGEFSGKLGAFKAFTVHVNDRSRLISAPVETGEMATDHKVIDPTIITVSGTVNRLDEEAANVISKLESMFTNQRLEFCSVVTNEAAWSGLILKDKPHKEDSDRPDLIAYEIVFQEIILVQGKTGATTNSENGNTTNTGYCAAVRV